MAKINWGRVFLCGILTGGVLYLLQVSVFVFALGGTEFAAAVEAARAARPPAFPALPFILYLAGGVWAMWLYASIRPRYGPGPKTAAVAGVGLWIIGALIDANWSAHGFIPPPEVLLAPVAAALPAVIVAAVVGAWPYKE